VGFVQLLLQQAVEVH
jgi:hypothetical protein